MKTKLIIIISLGLLLFSCQWDNPYDLNNEIRLSLTSMPDTICNDSTYVIQWEVEANRKGKPVRNFELKISLYRNNLFLEEITRCNSNDKQFVWHIDVLKTYLPYKIQIKSIENYDIQTFGNEFTIIHANDGLKDKI